MQGKYVRTRHHREWDKQVQKLVGGMTIMKPTTKGTWLDTTGKMHTDRTIPVKIFCDRSTIEKICKITAKHYKQLAVMAYRISDEVIIYEQSIICSQL